MTKTTGNIEIERKFLLNGDFRPFVTRSYRIVQGYLVAQIDCTVRIRIKSNKGYITVKGPANEKGFSRFEWEKEIGVEDARQLLQLCKEDVIDKTRHEVIFGNKTFEVDEFHANNEGLFIVELELQSEDDPFDTPSWLGKEITGDRRFYNAYLFEHPYQTWETDKCRTIE